MCGRYNIIDDAATRALLESLGIDARLPTRVNIAPTENVPVIVHEKQKPAIHEMRWWLTPSWAPEVSNKYSMFNARSETLDTSRAFKGPYRHHRGLLPASSFIEWSKNNSGQKQPYLVTPAEGCFAFAGLWDSWRKGDSYLESCAVVTTEAVEGLRWLHHRMPVLIEAPDFEAWLDPTTDKATLDEIRSKTSSRAFNAYPLSPEVSNSRIKDVSLLDPIDEPIEIKH
ncbi:MAG: SOS response-associated peptidase [Pseudomonadales bacterium]|nr:SOS response-associated peptidase [Pseudomonadales bacterium]